MILIQGFLLYLYNHLYYTYISINIIIISKYYSVIVLTMNLFIHYNNPSVYFKLSIEFIF